LWINTATFFVCCFRFSFVLNHREKGLAGITGAVIFPERFKGLRSRLSFRSYRGSAP
jgi:hypothetical protein